MTSFRLVFFIGICARNSSGEVGTMIAEKLWLILLTLTVKSANKVFQQNLLISKRLFFGQNDKLCNLSDDKTRHFSAGCY